MQHHRTLALAALVAVTSGGCMTFQTRSDPGYVGARTYSGSRTDVRSTPVETCVELSPFNS